LIGLESKKSMKTSVGIILLIVGLVVGGLGSYAVSSGQISSLSSQVSSLQAQVTTLQGSVSSLQSSLSSSQSQVAALNGQLQTLQVPLVTILSCPSTASVGEHFTVVWNVTGGIPGVITHSAIHRGMSMTDIISLVVSGNTPQTFSAVIAAPNQTGTFSIRAHAIVDGTSYFSPLQNIAVVQPTSFNLQISAARIIVNKEETVAKGVPLTLTVRSVGGFNSPVTLSLVGVPNIAVFATLSPTVVTPPANGEVSANLSVAVITLRGGIYETQPPFGVYSLSVIGTSGSITQSDALQVVVTNPLSSYTVTIIGSTFKPSTITIPVGGTVVWTNTDPVTHTVTSSTGIWDSGDLPTGQSFVYTFNSTGTFNYYDKYYPSLTGTVVVSPL
jgi:plastocyanin/outer membrane murein-binding lipoprotein Lpp